MNERQRKQYELGKGEIAMGRMVYGMYLFIAVASTTAIAASFPSALLDTLPKWANITMAVSGALNLPGSIEALPKMRKWLKDADKTIKDFETNYINAPVGSQNS
ncbi:MAG: hypothetical protein A2860_03660 [Candidatus Levybacteria bacterium RIFCSPHIGHO2_01_FULL_37_33]|nr:MAG: hypothetical protein A2860_03660 [Candidatus Levybacteria bacterium RIFCSPHIGHO2_01_FULL_37_33]OGH15719.1 MAG: hypothetical protein A3C97_01970 [Candidatus Levybacteria bacterium RIFCSPHIGHO2_02_FULL_37_11]OGH29272.1 MAG: hypothetical protein A3F30_03020 [Candidatus Levybacteria bacterium RIFCSPHIGHO2_12_FULL_37_12]OGH33025.1 MAG: hypothetical protein A2953_03645 [Candidatus Levybacteria bacterium RIFCSPLOWO2_01_FULL_36_54]